MELFALDSKRGILVADNEVSGAFFAAIRFQNMAKQAIEESGQFCVALAGGNTPKLLYRTLSEPQFANHIDWAKVKLFWSDERAVPPDDPDSNYGMAMKYFSEGALATAKVFRMRADSPNLEKAALDYENEIKQECRDGAFDLILLGMGDDGHIASLFPGTEALQVTNRLCVANYVPQKKCWRMTLTFECIFDARRVMLLCFGADKKKAFHESLQGRHPAGQLGTGAGYVFYIIDYACHGQTPQEAALAHSGLKLSQDKPKDPKAAPKGLPMQDSSSKPPGVA